MRNHSNSQGGRFVFVHQRLDLDVSSHYAVRQSAEARAILSGSGKVKSVFQGHSHKAERKDIDGVPYITLTAMIEGSGKENNAYSVLELSGDGRAVLTGRRRQPSIRV